MSTFTKEELVGTEFGEDFRYDETVNDVILPKKVAPCKLLVKMIGELQTELNKNKSGIILPEQILNRSSAGSVVCEILQIGDQAFKSERFVYMNGAGWEEKYKIGDKILIKRMAGTILPGSKGTFQVIDDSAVEANYTG